MNTLHVTALMILASAMACARRPAAAVLGDGGAPESSVQDNRPDPIDEDPSVSASKGQERQEHLRQEHVFDARAGLERDLAGKQRTPEVKQQMLWEADKLSSMARKENVLLDNPK
jgi:hypothetical protein